MSRSMVKTIKKLLRLAERAATRFERDNAQSRAEALIIKHGLYHVTAEDYQRPVPGVQDLFWRETLLMSVAKFYGLSVRTGTVGGALTAVLIGEDDDKVDEAFAVYKKLEADLHVKSSMGWATLWPSVEERYNFDHRQIEMAKYYGLTIRDNETGRRLSVYDDGYLEALEAVISDSNSLEEAKKEAHSTYVNTCLDAAVFCLKDTVENLRGKKQRQEEMPLDFEPPPNQRKEEEVKKLKGKISRLAELLGEDLAREVSSTASALGIEAANAAMHEMQKPAALLPASSTCPVPEMTRAKPKMRFELLEVD